MSNLSPITFDNAEPVCWQLNMTQLRSATATQSAIFEHGYLQDHYVAIALIHRAFQPWASLVETTNHTLIEIPPSEALEAQAAFEALVDISPDAFSHSYEIDNLVNVLKRAADENITVLISQD